MSLAFLALGSNLGDRLAHLRFAVEELEHRGVEVEAKSRIYRSASVGSGGEGEFLNAALRVRIDLSALELLQFCQQIEAKAGRALPAVEGAKREGSRALDIDIVTFNDTVSNTPSLLLPHPRALERPFVLLPLLDILDSQEVTIADLQW